MHYLTRFTETKSERVRAVVDPHWNLMRNWIHLLAGVCYPFPEVMKALSEPMCVFPIEGLPSERYFPGTQVMDEIENRAEELLRRIFSLGDDYRATSGTQANQIVFNAVLKQDITVLSLNSSYGGHISHKVLVGRRKRVDFYPFDEDAQIDYDALEKMAFDLRPKLVIAGGSACPREIGFARIGNIARRAGAFFQADVSHTATFIASGVHRTGFPVSRRSNTICPTRVKASATGPTALLSQIIFVMLF